MLILYIILGLVGGWFLIGWLTGVVAITMRNTYLNTPTTSYDLGVILVCGLLGVVLTIKCIKAVFGC